MIPIQKNRSTGWVTLWARMSVLRDWIRIMGRLGSGPRVTVLVDMAIDSCTYGIRCIVV